MESRADLTEFSGICGRVLRQAVSASSLISGLILVFVLLVGNWVLFQAGTPGAATPFTQIVLALAVSRFALNGLFGEWGGTIFSTRGGSWTRVSGVTARYLTLTGLWLVPMLLLGPGEDQIAQLMMLGPAAAGRFLAFAGFYLLALTLTPPLFLIVSARADRFADMFTGAVWREAFAGRMGDLFVIYAIYTGGVGMVLVLSIPLVVLGFMAGKPPGILVTGATFCLLMGLSANLLGRLCGFFACGEIGGMPAAPVAADRPDFPRPTPVVPHGSPVVLSTMGATAAAIPASGRSPAASASDGMQAAPCAATATKIDPGGAERRPPLLDAQQRVDGLLQRLAAEPLVVRDALEDLNRAYAPCPQVLRALCIARHRAGDTAGALELAGNALPLCFERGNTQLAAEIFRELLPHAPRLGLARDQIVAVAGALLRVGDLSHAAKTFTLVLSADPRDTRAIKGLLQVGDELLARRRLPDQAAKVYRYLLTHCADSPLVEYAERGLEAAERKLAATPA